MEFIKEEELREIEGGFCFWDNYEDCKYKDNDGEDDDSTNVGSDNDGNDVNVGYDGSGSSYSDPYC